MDSEEIRRRSGKSFHVIPLAQSLSEFTQKLAEAQTNPLAKDADCIFIDEGISHPIFLKKKSRARFLRNEPLGEEDKK